MADKLELGHEVRELKIGQSFTNPKSTAFHAIRYDFKPASIDVNKIATVDVGNNNQVTVTRLDGAGIPQTVFKGSQRPFNKECVLIIDKVTGEVTLEKLSSNIQVKKTRSESIKPPMPLDRSGQSNERSAPNVLSGPRSQTPPITQRSFSKTKVASGSRRADRPITQHLVPKHSPLHASPNYPSPNHHKSPKRDRDVHVSAETHPSQLASLPMIDDFSDPIVPTPHVSQSNSVQHRVEKSPTFAASDNENGVEVMSDSSSSSSSSDSDSDNDRTVTNKMVVNRTNGHSNGLPNSGSSSAHILTQDLCLSESGSDSD